MSLILNTINEFNPVEIISYIIIGKMILKVKTEKKYKIGLLSANSYPLFN